MAWREIKQKLLDAAKYIKENKVLDATLSGLLSSIPFAGPTIQEIWNNLDLSDEEKAVKVEEILTHLSEQDETHFRILMVTLNAQKVQLIEQKKTIDQIVDEARFVRNSLEEISQTGEAMFENTEEIKKIALTNQALLSQMLEQKNIKSISDVQKLTGKLSDQENQEISEIKKVDKAIRKAGVKVDKHNSYQLGLMEVLKNNYLDAEFYFNSALEADPMFGDAHTALGIMYQRRANELLRTGNYPLVEEFLKKATEHVDKALSLDAVDMLTVVQLGYIYKEFAQLQASLQNPKKFTDYLAKAELYFDKVLKVDEQNTSAHNGKGNVYFFKKDYDNAIKEHKKAIEIRPDYLEAHYDLAIVYYSKGNENPSLRKECYSGALKEFEILTQTKNFDKNFPPNAIKSIVNLMKIMTEQLNAQQ